MSKFFSRKLFMTLAGVAGLIAADFSATGTIHAATITACAAMVIGYAVAQGWVDGKEKENA